MGNYQCVSGRLNNNHLWNKIENDLHSKNTNRERKILNEFKNLKRMMTEKNYSSNKSPRKSNTNSNVIENITPKSPTRSLKDLHKYIESNPSMILIKSDCNLNIRMKRFIKWYKIGFVPKVENKIKKKKKGEEYEMLSPLRGLNSEVNSPNFKLSENNQFDGDDMKSFNFNLSNLELNERNFSSPISTNKRDIKTPIIDSKFSLNGGGEVRAGLEKNTEEDLDENKYSKHNNPSVTGERDSRISNESNCISLKNGDNMMEYNLRQYYIKHKHKFLDRVSKGPPDSFRWLSWRICAGITFPPDVSKNLLDQYFNKPLDEETEIQIKKDLPRTLGEDFCFDHPETENLLYKILRAFANLDLEVKYCQGMNFLVRFLLLISDFDEDETFLMMIYIFSNESFNNKCENSIFNGIRGFFLDNFLVLKFYIFVFNYYFERKMPVMFNHLKILELPIEVWVLKWFQTLYAIYLPTNSVARLWDCLLSHGSDFIIDFTLAILKMKETQILKIHEAFDLVDYFKTEFSNENMDIEEIIKIAKNMIKSKKKRMFLLKEEYEEQNNIKLDKFNIRYDLNITFTTEKMSSNFFSSNCTVSEDRDNNNNNCNDKIKNIPKNYLPSSDMNQSISSFIKDLRKDYSSETDNRVDMKQSDLGTSNFMITKCNTGTNINKSSTIITLNNNLPRSLGTNTDLEKVFTLTHKSLEELNENDKYLMGCISLERCENDSDLGNNDSMCNEFSSEADLSNNDIKNVRNNIYRHTIEIKKEIGIARISSDINENSMYKNV